jgi:hypothetical protein
MRRAWVARQPRASASSTCTVLVRLPASWRLLQVYGGAVAYVMGGAEPAAGDVVVVADHEATPIAWGVYNPVSMFRVRRVRACAAGKQASLLVASGHGPGCPLPAAVSRTPPPAHVSAPTLRPTSLITLCHISHHASHVTHHRIFQTEAEALCAEGADDADEGPVLDVPRLLAARIQQAVNLRCVRAAPWRLSHLPQPCAHEQATDAPGVQPATRRVAPPATAHTRARTLPGAGLRWGCRAPRPARTAWSTARATGCRGSSRT